MTASCESPVRTYERFTVTYTLLNNLQDFLAVRLVWTTEHIQAGKHMAMLTALVSTLLNHLSFSGQGSTLNFQCGLPGPEDGAL